MKVTRIRITDYRSIQSLDVPVGTNGALVTGANGAGKTSVLNALQAALLNRGVSPDAVRKGADRAEIVVDLDEASVRKVIPREGRARVSVSQGAAEWKQPQSRLDEVVGPTVDPLDLYLAKPAERRAKILAAIPSRVTIDFLRQFAPDVPPTTSTEGHGLEVLANVRAWYYEKRTGANAAEKAARAEAERLEREAAQFAVPEGDPDVPTLDEAQRIEVAARDALTRLEAQAEHQRRASEAAASTRARIDELRRTAGDTKDYQHDVDNAREWVANLTATVQRLESELAGARQKLAEWTQDAAECEAKLRRAEGCVQQADALEATLSAAGAVPVDDGAIERARLNHDDARERVKLALAADNRHAAESAARKMREMHAAAKSEADRLDGIVRALTDDAPRQLPGLDAIPGLALSGDDITLDGVRLDGLCGQEQLAFAVEIAKRANAGRGLKLLVCDGLERLDPKQMDAFVRLATDGGWQLLGSRVSDGARVIEALEPDDGPAPKLAPAAQAPAQASTDPAAQWIAGIVDVTTLDALVSAWLRRPRLGRDSDAKLWKAALASAATIDRSVGQRELTALVRAAQQPAVAK